MLFIQKIFFIIGSAGAFLGIVAGAFGSHLLKHKYQTETLDVYEVAVRYQMYHALAFLAVAWACGVFSSPLVPMSGWILLAGILIFSGSLYLYVFSGARFWGAITPIGGVILLLGWLCLAIGVGKS